MNRGFTLIELMVVILIIGTLAALLLSAFSGFSEDYDKANYKIETADGLYFVESYTKENNGQCFYIAEKELRFCGDFTVEKLNKEE